MFLKIEDVVIMIWFKCAGFLCVFAFGTHAMAMDELQLDGKSNFPVLPPQESNIKEEIEKIETLVKNLRVMDPKNFNLETARSLLKEQSRDYSMTPEILTKLYQSISVSGSGKEATVWKAILNEDRPQAGLKAGDTIAIRMVPVSPDKPLKEEYKSKIRFEALIRGSHLRNPEDKKVVTEYFPNFYGTYYGPVMPQTLVTGFYFSTMKSTFKDYVFCYEEMEWVDKTIEKVLSQNTKISDSVIFELMYGEWAGTFFIGLSVDDCKLTNYGLKGVKYGRAYHLGEDHYYFPRGDMPVRLDLQGFNKYPHPTTKKFYNKVLEIQTDEIATKEGKSFFQDLSNQKSDIFSLFSQHFIKYKKEPTWIKENDSTARYYELDQKWIDFEKTLPRD